jgi:3-phosphoshikimate 1-carboxyvinyltransferase
VRAVAGRALAVSRAPAGSLTPLRWTPPGDKSISQRATFLTSLCEGTSRIAGLLRSDDTGHNLAALRRLGAGIRELPSGDVEVRGVGLRGYRTDGGPLWMGNSATSARLALALLSGQAAGPACVVDGNDSLRRRPMAWVIEPLRRMGAAIEPLGAAGRLPVRVRGRRLRGAAHEAPVYSAQAVSPLLFAGLLAVDETRVLRRARARDHTERLLRHFGVRIDEDGLEVCVHPPERLAPRDVTVPGDISAGAVVLAAAALHPEPGLAVTVRPVGLNPTRTGFLDVLEAMGADVAVRRTGVAGAEPVGEVTVTSGRPLRGTRVEGPELVQSTIDELPLVAALGACAQGPTAVADAAELRDKDSDRIATTCALVRAFGADAEPTTDGFTVTPPPGGRLRSPGRVSCFGDHRVAFAAAALAGRLDEPVVLDGWEVTDVSFPGAEAVLGRLMRMRPAREAGP